MKDSPHKPGISLKLKLILVYLLFILIIINVGGWYIYYKMKYTLDKQAGEHLINIGNHNRSIIQEFQINLSPGDEDSNTYKRIQEKLKKVKDSFNLERVLILKPDGKVVVDSNQKYNIGEYYSLIEINYEEFLKVRDGDYTPTFLYKGADNKFYKSVFIPLQSRKKEKIFGVLEIENTAGYLEIIKKLRGIIILGEFLIIIFAVLLGVIITQWITTPIDKMVYAAKLFGKGHYKNRIEVKSNDELGMLALSLNEMADKIEERDLQLKQLSAGVAHEVRNPLTGIKTSIDYLSRNIKLDEDSMEILQGIENEVKSLSGFVNDFLTFSKKIVLQVDEFDLVKVFKSIMRMYSDQIKTRNIRVNIEEDQKIIEADKDKLRNVFSNIMLNAIHAIGKEGEITIEIEDAGTDFRILVKDTGVGIKDENLKKIFEPFYTSKATGTGLGLAIARNIVKAHHGSIYMERNAENNTPGSIHTGTVCVIILKKRI